MLNENTGSVRAKAPVTDAVFDKISQIVCEISEDVAIQQCILNGIEDNLYFGRDEELRFIDILFPENSKLIRDRSKIEHLTITLCKYFDINVGSRIEENLENPYVNYILKNDLHIYFPYSREITETPTIVAVDIIEDAIEDNPNVIFPAYKKERGEIKPFELKLSDELMEEYPLWIITRNTTPYEDLPNFVAGETIMNGVIFATRNPKGLTHIVADDDPPPGLGNDPNKIYTLHVGNVICSTTSFDLTTGPEIMFKFITAKMNGANPVKETYAASKYKFTRKECKNQTENFTTNVLVDDWKIENIYGGFEVYEQDPGYSSQRDIPITLSVPNYVNFSTTIPIGKYDDEIYQASMSRVAYFSTAHSDFFNGFTSDGWPRRGAGGNVKFAFKYTESNRAY